MVARLLIGAGEGALFTAAITWVLAGGAGGAARPDRRPLRPLDVGRPRARTPLAAALAAATSTTAVWWACVLAPMVPAVAIAAGARPRESGVAPFSAETVDTVKDVSQDR